MVVGVYVQLPFVHVPMEEYVTTVVVSLQVAAGGMSQRMPAHGSPLLELDVAELLELDVAEPPDSEPPCPADPATPPLELDAMYVPAWPPIPAPLLEEDEPDVDDVVSPRPPSPPVAPG